MSPAGPVHFFWGILRAARGSQTRCKAKPLYRGGGGGEV